MILLPGQVKELYALATMPAAADFDTACRALAENLARVLSAPMAVIRLSGGRWQIVAAAGTVSTPRRFAMALRRATGPRAPEPGSNALVVAGALWTHLTLWDRGDERLLLMVGGDWTLSRELLEDAASRLGAALPPIGERDGRRLNPRLRAALTLSRRLGTAASAAVPGIVAEACARATGAERASVALYDGDQRVLTVKATFGYPMALVRHLRLRPGAGIIGSVFRTGRALVNKDGGSAIERRRSRYRTAALISVPLVGHAGILGVVSVCDPPGRASFDRFDLRVLRSLASIASLALDRVHANEQAEAHGRLAAIDPLTGLFNRRHFHSRLEEEVERSRRQTSPLALLVLDVDGLKELNDHLGHSAGDDVLRAVADVLRRSVRVFDVCARFGGDEYATLMPGADAESARQVAERIRRDTGDLRPSFGPWAGDLRVTVSIGIATFNGATAHDLFARADQALYLAKRQGKNCVAIG